jgi:hypothetical protein
MNVPIPCRRAHSKPARKRLVVGRSLWNEELERAATHVVLPHRLARSSRNSRGHSRRSLWYTRVASWAEISGVTRAFTAVSAKPTHR